MSSIALSQAVIRLENRVAALESAVQIILQARPMPVQEDSIERIVKLEGELRALKARMGKIREPV